MPARMPTLSEPIVPCHALLLDAAGGARELAPDALGDWTPDQGCLWLHFDALPPDPDVARQYALDDVAFAALSATESRPRAFRHGDGLLVSLRGVNLRPGAAPDDLVSLRLWVEQSRVVSVAQPDVHAVPDVRAELEQGGGPADSGALLVAIGDAVACRINPVVDELEELVDKLEEAVGQESTLGLRGQLAELRRQAIGLRRYLAPQRDMMTRLHTEAVSWLHELDRARLREVADHFLRHVEDLDMLRDHAAVVQDELTNQINEHLNQRMYVLMIFSTIFLPLTFLTGMLGTNVGGIPGAQHPFAFWIEGAVLALIGVVQFWVLRRMKLV